MMTLTHAYRDSPTPCHHLLQHYKVTRPLRLLPRFSSHVEFSTVLPVTHLYDGSVSDVSDVSVWVQLGGGPVEGLVEALQSLGLTEGVRLLKNTKRRDDKHSTGNTHTHTHSHLYVYTREDSH